MGLILVFVNSCKKDDDDDALTPVLSTAEVADITLTTATSGGEITDDSGAEVTARGVCWSTSENPIIEDSKTEDGAGIGAFTSSITELEPATTYYVRAYATNSKGTGYGNTMSFSTTGVVDVDGNIYSIVIIGEQEWMAENLKTTKYNDGIEIPLVTDNDAWDDLSTSAYCWYDNDESNKDPYGALYNWHTVETGKLCPTGWHVPTDAEWGVLVDYVGEEAATKLKATSGWDDGYNGADEYGFSALPGGYRLSFSSVTFYNMGTYANWWCNTEDENNATKAWSKDIWENHSDLIDYSNAKTNGLSVRCIKDK